MGGETGLTVGITGRPDSYGVRSVMISKTKRRMSVLLAASPDGAAKNKTLLPCCVFIRRSCARA